MARIETSTNLVGKTIVLADGTKSKIEAAIASGYKVKGRTTKIATRCVVKEGAHFKEIERMSLTQLEDTGEGYVKLKDAKAAKKPAAKADKKATGKAAAGKAGAKAKTSGKTAKEKEPKVRRKTSEEHSDDYQALAESIIKGGRAKPAVEIEQTDEALTDAVAKRLYDTLMQTDIAKVCADNKTPIANDLNVTYAAEYAAESRSVQITFNLQYAAPVSVAAAPELDEAVLKRAAKLAAKKVGKVLSKAICAAFDLEDANDLLPGTLLISDDETYAFVGESAKHAGKALMYNVAGDSFKSFGADKLTDFELVADEEEEESEEEEEEVEEEEEEEESEEETEDEGEEAGEDDEYEYVSVDKDQIDLINKKVTAKYHAALAERFNVSEEALIPGLVLSDGDTTFAYLGCDSKGGLLVIDTDAEDEDDNVLLYSKTDLQELEGFYPSVGDSTEDDGEDFNDDESEEEGEDDGEEDGEEEEDGEDGEDGEDDNDFDFDDAPSEDLEDLSEDELRDRVLELGLTTVRKADKMNAKQLRALLEE